MGNAIEIIQSRIQYLEAVYEDIRSIQEFSQSELRIYPNYELGMIGVRIYELQRLIKLMGPEHCEEQSTGMVSRKADPKLTTEPKKLGKGIL